MSITTRRTGRHQSDAQHLGLQPRLHQRVRLRSRERLPATSCSAIVLVFGLAVPAVRLSRTQGDDLMSRSRILASAPEASASQGSPRASRAHWLDLGSASCHHRVHAVPHLLDREPLVHAPDRPPSVSPAVHSAHTLPSTRYREAISTDRRVRLVELHLRESDTVVVTMIVATPAAYALCHRSGSDWFGPALRADPRPDGAGIRRRQLALLQRFNALGLLNSYQAVILADSTIAVPFAIIIMRAFMLGIPHELAEAARR